MKIYQNAFYVPSTGIYYCSWSSHDFVGCKFEDGREYYVDGGLSYFRTVGDFVTLINDGTVVDFRLDENDTKEKIYQTLLMWSAGHKAYRPLREFSKSKLFSVLEIFTKPTHFSPIVKETALYWFNQ